MRICLDSEAFWREEEGVRPPLVGFVELALLTDRR